MWEGRAAGGFGSRAVRDRERRALEGRGRRGATSASCAADTPSPPPLRPAPTRRRCLTSRRTRTTARCTTRRPAGRSTCAASCSSTSSSSAASRVRGGGGEGGRGGGRGRESGPRALFTPPSRRAGGCPGAGNAAARPLARLAPNRTSLSSNIYPHPTHALSPSRRAPPTPSQTRPAVRANNVAKAALVYGAIAASGGFYHSPVDPACQSKMNVPFTIPSNPDLE